MGWLRKEEQLAPVIASSIDRTKGLDVSHFQGHVDWQKAYDLGFRFVFAKATDGEIGKDAMFASHKHEAKAAGMLFGAYHFHRFLSDPVKQAEHFVRTTGGVAAGELPHVLDVESDRSSDGKYIDQMDDAGASRVMRCLKAIESLTGVPPIIYTGAYFFTGFENPERFKRYMPWIPSYADKFKPNGDLIHVPKPWDRWAFWQSSEDFKLGNIEKIDTNVFRGSIADLKRLTKQ